MTKLREQIESDIVAAMRSRDQGRLDALRFLKSAIQAQEKTKGSDLDEAGLIQVISKQVNDRRESIQMFRQGKRDDLVAKESEALEALEAYMPPQLGQEELEELVRQVIGEVGASGMRDKGRVMGKLMPQVRGKADGAQVNALVDEALGAGG